MILYYYIYKICNYYLSFYHKCKSKIFFIQDIKTNNCNYNNDDNNDNNDNNVNNDNNDNNNIIIIYLKLYFFYFLNYLINIMPNKIRLFLEDKFNNYDNNKLIKIKFSNGKVNRNIIYKEINSYKLSKNIKLNYSYKNFFDQNELIMLHKIVILDIFYKDDTNNKISIKNIIENYADKNKLYDDNTIKNIFLLENINKNKIYTTYLQGILRREKEFDLKISDYHITELYNF